MKVEVLKPLPYAADGINTTVLAVGSCPDLPAEIVTGLEAAKYVQRLDESRGTLFPDPNAAGDPATDPTAADDPAVDPTAADDPATDPAAAGDPAEEPTAAGDPATDPTAADDPAEEPTAADGEAYHIQPAKHGRFDVIGPDGKPVNGNPLAKKAAEKLADERNAAN